MQDRAGDDEDEEPVESGEDRAEEHVDPLEAVLLHVDPFVHHRSLYVELHIRRDRGAYKRKSSDERGLLQRKRRNHRVAHDIAPWRADDEGADGIREVREDKDEERPLDDPVAEEDHEDPDEDGRDWNGPDPA